MDSAELDCIADVVARELLQLLPRDLAFIVVLAPLDFSVVSVRGGVWAANEEEYREVARELLKRADAALSVNGRKVDVDSEVAKA